MRRNVTTDNDSYWGGSACEMTCRSITVIDSYTWERAPQFSQKRQSFLEGKREVTRVKNISEPVVGKVNWFSDRYMPHLDQLRVPRTNVLVS